ncbi:MAG: SynChlorMet cassette radical SAM/SPASM protein ScmF [Candidatus Aminicenantes bacterium]|nr:SynChlorMet cassette radical SAM/SPASM protein ScmF [Candidatus Aminicenantes bacterium]
MNVTQEKSVKPEKRKYPLNQIYFYLTGGCNLRCRHCWIESKYKEGGHSLPALGLDLFQSIIKQAKPLGLSCVKLTGGEPLLHPQIKDILELIHAENLGFSLETNGLLCSPELASKMADCKNSFIAVSLDGSEAQTHEWVRGIDGCFEDTLNGIRNLVKAGLRPQIIMTIMRRNKDQMEAVVRLAESLGVGSVKFNILQSIARGERMYEAGEALPIEELIGLGNWVENVLSPSTSLRLYYSQPMAFLPLGKIFSDNGGGSSICRILNILGVLSDGSYALCGIGETVPELVFGRAASDQLEDIWDKTPAYLELREGIPHRFEGICRKCLMKGLCLGSCVAQNYYRSKNFWTGNWFCEEAHQHGLFPETRIIPRNRNINS